MFWYCVKIVHAMNWWMEKVDVANSNIKILTLVPARMPLGLNY